MSDNMAPWDSDDNWVEDLQKKLFEECIAVASKKVNSRSTDDLEVSSSTWLREVEDPEIVPISVIIDHIRRSFVNIPHFRKHQQNDFLEELRRSLQRKACDGKRVTWVHFRDGAKLWFLNLANAVHLQNNNHGFSNNHSAPTSTEFSERESSAGEHSCSDVIDGDYSSSNNQLNAMETCYSFNSSSTEIDTADSMIEYSDRTNQVDEDVTVDLQIRMRRYNEETTNLKAELLRAEETISNLESEVKSKQVNVEKISIKYTKLQKELEEHRDMLAKLEKQEETSRRNMRLLEKSYNVLQKKLAELEKEKDDISTLNARIEKLSKQKSECLKQLSGWKFKYNEKVVEYEYLQEKYNTVQTNYLQLEQIHEKILKEHLEKIEEVQILKNDLQQKLNGSNDSFCSQSSTTPPTYAGTHLHSTPYNNKNNSCHDSLFNELKASGINMNETKVQELKEELSSYEEEIAAISVQIDEALQNLAISKNEICTPDVQLVKTNCIQRLKYKITSLLNAVKNYPATKVPPVPLVPLIGEESREKPDILPKKGGYVFSDRDFATDKEENDLIATVPNSIRNKNVWYQLPEISGIEKLNETGESYNEKPEVFIPINEALERIKELKEIHPETDKLPPPNPKHRSIFTCTARKPNWTDLIEDQKAKSDVTFDVKPKPSVSSQLSNNSSSRDMKNLKDDTCASTNFESTTSSTPIPKLDTRYVTMIRPFDKTYLVNPVVSSTVDKSLEKQESSFDDVRSEIPCHRTPDSASHGPGLKRKLSVYHRSFNVDSLQTPDKSVQNIVDSEKKRSISTPDAQETMLSLRTNLTTSFTSADQLTCYRCANNSAELSDSSSSKHDDSLTKDLQDIEYSIKEEKKQVYNKARKTVIAPSRFKFPDMTVNRTAISCDELEFTPIVGRGILSKNAKKDDSQHSRVLSSSENLVEKEESRTKHEVPSIIVDTSTVESIVLEYMSTDVSNYNSTYASQKIMNSVTQSKIQVDEKTCLEKGADDHGEMMLRKTTSSNSKSKGSAAVTTTLAEPILGDYKNGGGASDEMTAARSSRVPTAVGRAMSSGEDSSAESECNVRKNTVPESSTQPVIKTGDGLREEDEKKERQDSTKSDNSQDTSSGEVKKPSPIINGDNEEISSQKVVISSSPPDVIKEEEIPIAFPSWTDEKLHESSIASFPDIASEISEILNEEQLRKKCTSFSIGLSADRMTLSKRTDLAARRRDLSEQNFNNEIKKMQMNIKELAPLCVDSESLERVERVRTQAEMVSRCAQWISCSAETLGAVRQERRVSRAVLLADKYLQTLRSKCEKLASEIAEMKKILAENNIVLEDNLNELGDDVPRVRYRTVPNNNRTMMARRRASIATISRPLLGSNQDISKEVLRQRNSVSGRAPGLRRPSLCPEVPKCEIDKLDCMDSSNSITELREIFEQTESRRHSREENNNLLRTSVNNLSMITSEHTEEEKEVWSNSREDIIPDLENNNETNPIISRQQYRNPVICWFLTQYFTWKPMLWGIFIAFLLGVFVTRVVSSSKRNGPPLSWYSLEEILSQYMHVENAKPPAV